MEEEEEEEHLSQHSFRKMIRMMNNLFGKELPVDNIWQHNLKKYSKKIIGVNYYKHCTDII